MGSVSPRASVLAKRVGPDLTAPKVGTVLLIFGDLVCSMVTGLSSIILGFMLPLVLLCVKSEVHILL